MKIIIITPGALPFPPINGGAVENLISLYIEANEKEYKNNYTVISKFTPGIEEYSKKYKYTNSIYINEDSISFKIKKIFRYILRHILKLNIGNAYINETLKIIKNINFDILIVENEPLFINELRKYYPNKKIYLHLHNDSLHSRKVIKKYDKIITVSNYLKNKIKDIEPNANVNTLHNATKIERFNKTIKQEEVQKTKEKYNISKDKKIIMYVGRVQKEKGILELIQAFNCVNKNNNLQLVIVGASFFKNSKNDKFSKKIKKLIEDNNKDIMLTGFIDYNDIHQIFSLADIGVVPSQCNEAFGMTLLEFMAAGIPTIITNDGALPEIATKETSIVIDKGEKMNKNIEKAIMTLLNNETLRKKMKKNSIIRANEFNVNNYVENFNKLIGDKNE